MARSWRMKVPNLEAIAAKLVPLHGGLMGDGYQLTGSSGVWRTKGGSMTARFVYRHHRARDGVTTMTFVVRGIRV